MKQSFTVLALIVFLGTGFSASAQNLSKKWSIGFGLEGGIPLGTSGDSYDFTGGVTVRFSYHVGPGFVTLTSGARLYAPKSMQGENTKAAIQIPVKVGYKYVFNHLFVMGELGYSSFKYYYDDGSDQIASASTSGFTYAPTVGVQFGVFEAGIKYEGISVTGGTVSDLSLRLGLNL